MPEQTHTLVCPISLEIMRHPVFVTDSLGNGHYYELKELCKYLKTRGLIEPQTRKKIIAIAHGTDKEAQINADVEASTDRYEPYDKRAYMKEAQSHLAPWSVSRTCAAFFNARSTRATGTGLITLLAVPMMFHGVMHDTDSPVIQEHVRLDESLSLSTPIGLMIGFLDYGIRTLTRDQHSLGTTVVNTIASLTSQAAHLIPQAPIEQARSVLIRMNNR